MISMPFWKKDIDNEGRTPDFMVRLRKAVAGTGGVSNAEKELRSIGIKRGWKVVDFGSGTGHFSLAAARIVGEGGVVHAVDLHPLSLEMIEKDAARNGLSNIETIYSDLETGLDEESVNAVLLQNALGGRKNVRDLLNEVHRIMKDSGILWVRERSSSADRVAELMLKDGLFHMMEKGKDTFRFSKVKGGFHEI